MKQVVVKCGKSVLDKWVSQIAQKLPEFEVLPYTSELVRQDDVSYVAGWKPDALWVNEFPNIKALASIGSGVDHIANLSQLREGIPVLRTVAPDLAQKMLEFVVMCTLSWQRQLVPMIRANDRKEWAVFDAPLASELTVGIMGYGQMGKAVAGALSSLGFHIKVWSRSAREGLPYAYYNGKENLGAFATGCDVLVCLLPLTQETNGIINYDLMKHMNKGGCLINSARGNHLMEDDLFRVLDEQWLSYAFLDVLSKEPMPVDDPIWDRKNIIILYHCAAYINSEVGSRVIADNIRKFDKGIYDGPVYNPALGY